MSSTIRKIDNNTIEKITTEQIDLTPYKQELEELRQMKEPTDKELLIWAKQVHPYYSNRDAKMTELKELIG